MASITIQKISTSVNSQTNREIDIILEAFCKWMNIYQKTIPSDTPIQDVIFGGEMERISFQTAGLVSTETIELLKKTTSEGRLNFVFLDTLLSKKEYQAKLARDEV